MKNKYLLALVIIGTMFTACDDDDDNPPPPAMDNEEEVITTLNYTLISAGGDTVVFSFRDLDGDGGNAPVIMEGTLDTNTTYSGSVQLWNETETPAEDITIEIRDEDDEHQFFYTPAGNNVTFSYADMDENNLPVGLLTTVTTAGTGSSTVTITLRHEPDKTAMGVSSGDITNAGGETDIEVNFTFAVQ